MSRAFIQLMQSDSATHAPVIAAVRVPPSAWITSQSTVICRSPSAGRSTTARNERPIRRWISSVRPPCLPAEASRRVRSLVARGSMPYSAVTQPRACPLSQGGRRSSSVAVTSTCVSPNFTKHEPSAYFTTPRSSETARSSSGCRRLGRIGNPWQWPVFASAKPKRRHIAQGYRGTQVDARWQRQRSCYGLDEIRRELRRGAKPRARRANAKPKSRA